MTSRKLRPVLLTAVPLLFAALYFIVDPGRTAWMPRCMFHSLTGLDCPGCGSQRMIHALLHGDFAAAWSHNAFLLCLIPWLVALLLTESGIIKNTRLRRFLHSPAAVGTICLAIIVWTILRNL